MKTLIRLVYILFMTTISLSREVQMSVVGGIGFHDHICAAKNSATRSPRHFLSPGVLGFTIFVLFSFKADTSLHFHVLLEEEIIGGNKL